MEARPERGAVSARALHEQKRWTFEQIAPEPISPDGGLPEPIDQGEQRFALRQSRRGPRQRATLMFTMGDVGLDEMVVGQEVDRLYRWTRTQRATVGAIAELEPVMRTLQRNGILDADFRVADEASLEALFHDVARAGRADAYPADGPALSAGVLKASRQLAECDADLTARLSEAQFLGTELDSLRARISAVRFEAKALYERRAQQGAERDAASLIREKAQVLAWIDTFAGAVSGWATAFKGAMGPAGISDEVDMGAGSYGALSAVGKLVVNQTYERQVDEAFARVRALRRRAEVAEDARLAAEIDALTTSMRGYVEQAVRVRKAIESYRTSRARSFAALGSTVAEALPRMGRGATGASKGPFGGRSARSAGRVQRLFANVPVCEEALALADRITWPDLQGPIPMSGFLFWSDHSSVLADLGEEAAKLRWWRAHSDAVRDLLERIRGAIDGTGERAQSPR